MLVRTLRLFSSAPTQTTDTPSRYFKVKLCRGFIGLPDVYRKWARTLGLRKRGQTSYVPVIAPKMGAILKIKELVKVDLVNEKPEHVNPVYPKGYEVVDSYMNKPLL